jgi:hypothetical protein
VGNIDKQRIAAVRKLEQLGCTLAGEWMQPANDASVAILVSRATALECRDRQRLTLGQRWVPGRSDAGRVTHSLRGFTCGVLPLPWQGASTKAPTRPVITRNGFGRARKGGLTLATRYPLQCPAVTPEEQWSVRDHREERRQACLWERHS